jgi:hypothetical protein
MNDFLLLLMKQRSEDIRMLLLHARNTRSKSSRQNFGTTTRSFSTSFQKKRERPAGFFLTQD